MLLALKQHHQEGKIYMKSQGRVRISLFVQAIERAKVEEEGASFVGLNGFWVGSRRVLKTESLNGMFYVPAIRQFLNFGCKKLPEFFRMECFVQCQHALRMFPLLGGDNFDGRRSSLWHTSSWLGKIKAARENEDAPWQGVIP